jgi:hypothetical protein
VAEQLAVSQGLDSMELISSTQKAKENSNLAAILLFRRGYYVTRAAFQGSNVYPSSEIRTHAMFLSLFAGN